MKKKYAFVTWYFGGHWNSQILTKEEYGLALCKMNIEFESDSLDEVQSYKEAYIHF